GAVRVIEEGAVLVESKFVGEHPTRLNRWLADERRAVHIQRHFQPVPMSRCRFRQLVMEDYSNPIAFVYFNRWTRHAAAIAPAIHVPARKKGGFYHLRGKVEYLDAVI